MNDLLERMVARHREEWAKRERLLLAELESRRRKIAELAEIDIAALREQLAI
jgi:hypothetical protein